VILKVDETSAKTPGFEEIAEKLGLTPANARQRFKRCLDKLREIVFNNPGYEELINL
jgi:dephospho-CoA kinase